MTQQIKKVDHDLIWDSLNPEILCILYYGRSGSLFFQSLLDGHEQVMMFPAATILRYNEFWEEYGNKELDDKIFFFCAACPCLFDPAADKSGSRLTELGPNKDENIAISRDQFVLHLKAFLRNRPVNRKNFFLAAHYAYALCRGEDLSEKKLLVHALHSPHRGDRIKPFMEDFPLTKMVMLVRDPLKTLMSVDRYNVRKFKMFHGDFIYELVFRRLIPFDTWVFAFKPHLTLASFCPKSRIRALRLEDLHTDSANILKKVAGWLGITYADSLLKSTFGNKLWWGDNSLEFYVNGFSPHIQSGDVREHYYPVDIYVLGFLLEDIFVGYGYRAPHTYKGILRKLLVFICVLAPTKKEVLVLKDCFSPGYFRYFFGLAGAYHKSNQDMGLIFTRGGFLAVICCKYISGIVKLFLKILLRQARFYSYFFRRLAGKTVVFELIK